MAMHADSTTTVLTTCMLPSVLTVIRESNELIRSVSVSVSVWAAAGTANSKAKKAAKKFFMEVRLNYSLAAGRLEEQSCIPVKTLLPALPDLHPPARQQFGRDTNSRRALDSQPCAVVLPAARCAIVRPQYAPEIALLAMQRAEPLTEDS